MSDATETAEILGHLAILCRESATFRGPGEIGAALNEAAGLFQRLRMRLLSITDKPSIAFVGLSNVGKSTLLNALLEADLLPRQNGPCTPVAIELRYGDSFTVCEQAGVERQNDELADACGVQKALSDKFARWERSGESAFRRVSVTAPLPALESGLRLIDTPGFGAASADAEHERHEIELTEFLAKRRIPTVWVVNGQQGISARERDFHDKYLAQVCDDVAVTSCEDWDERDKQRFCQRFGAHLRRRTLSFHFVSGLDAIEGARLGDQERVARSGVREFWKHITDGANPGFASQQAVTRAVALLGNLAHLSRELGLQSIWREDSWHRWREVLPTARVKAVLNSELQGFPK